MQIIRNIKNNILGFIIGAVVFGSIGITVASQILATQVSYTNEKSTSNITSVDGALTELYDIALDCINNAGSGSDITYKGKDAVALYLDPTGSATNCSESNYSSTASTGCFRFYVYAEDGEYKYAILDHNTTATVSGFYVAQSQVKEDTKTWNPNLQARNIRADEVYKITESTNNASSWQIKNGYWFYFNKKNGDNGQGYGWLFDRTDDCTRYGCTTNDSSTWGYWTSDARDSDSSCAWDVNFKGDLGDGSISYSGLGVRPVIQIAK